MKPSQAKLIAGTPQSKAGSNQVMLPKSASGAQSEKTQPQRTCPNNNPLTASGKLSIEAKQALDNGQFEMALQMYGFLCRNEPTNLDFAFHEAEILWLLNRPIQARKCALESMRRSAANAQLATLLARMDLSCGETAKARKQLEAVVATTPNYAQARLLLADLLTREGEGASAYLQFTKVLELCPDNIQARLNVVSGMANLGKVTEAIKLARDGLAISPQSTELLIELGLLQMQVGWIDEARRSFRAAKEHESKDPIVYQMLAITSGAANDWTSASEYARSLIEFDPQGVDAALLSAWCAYGAGDLAEAKTGLERTIELYPDDPSVHNLYGIVLADLLRFPQARAQFAKTAQLEPFNQEAKLNTAMLDLIEGKAQDALGCLTSSLNFSTTSSFPYSICAYAYLLCGKLNDAKKMAQRALTTDDGDTLAKVVLACVLRDEGDLDEALKRFCDLDHGTRGSAFIQCQLAQTYLSKDDYQNASKAAQLALQLSPSNQQAKKVLARCLSKQGNIDGALLYFKELAGRNPKDLSAKIELAKSLVDKGDLEAATIAYEAAQKLCPNSPEPIRGLLEVARRQGDKRWIRKLDARLRAFHP